jgi:hypothetical protein
VRPPAGPRAVHRHLPPPPRRDPPGPRRLGRGHGRGAAGLRPLRGPAGPAGRRRGVLPVRGDPSHPRRPGGGGARVP